MGYTARMRRSATLALLARPDRAPAHAFDLQGHRGARGLAPENTLAAFETRACDRRHHARTRSRDDQGRRAGRQPRPPAQSRPHARAGRQVPRRARARPIRSLTLRRGAALRRRPAQARHRLCDELSRAAAGRRRAHPGADRVFDLVKRARRRSRPLQHRDQDHADLRRRDAGPGDLRGRARQGGARAGLPARVTIQSFDWRTLDGDEAHRAGDRARLPHRRGADLRHYPARRAGPLAVARRARYRRLRRLGAAPRAGRRLRGLVAALPQRHAGRRRRPRRRSA